ncbi:hypothetical protein RSAG8_11819, partial [Rhizoctonia solani AG-8 WAC10335]
MVEITEELWPTMLPILMLIEVELDFSRWERIHVTVRGRSRYYEVNLTTETVEDLKNKVQATDGIPSREQYLWCSNQSYPRFDFQLSSGKLIYQGVGRKSTILVLDAVASAELAYRTQGGCGMGHR